MEPTNLCMTCKKMPDCLAKGDFGRETCSEYESHSISELLERDRFVRAFTVGACPVCGGHNTYDCENNPLLEDDLVGHCLDCETYWCLECGHIFESVEKEMECPHWPVCEQCYEEHGYLVLDEFIDTICPTCEHYDNECQLENLSDCEKLNSALCPYDANVSECPRIEELLEGQM